MKNSKNFSSYDELINYYGSVENIPSNVLAVVEDQGSQVLFSVSNNLSQSGEQYNEGGYNLDEEDREKLDYSYTTVQEIELSYASKDYVADYVSQHGPDLTGYATESYVVGKIEDVVGVAPAALDTLKEIADSLNNDSDFAGTMTTALSNKADKNELNSYVSTSSLESMGYATESYVVDYVNTYGGGEDNVQADWNVTDSNSDSYILNKPNIKMNSKKGIIINDSAGIDNVNQYGFATGNSISKVGNFSFASGQNITVNHNYSGAIGSILNTYNAGEFACGQSNYSTTDVTFTHGIGSGFGTRKNSILIKNNGDLYAYGIGNYDGTNPAGAYSLAQVIDNLENAGGGSSVQADWNESDSSSDSYILNKPAIKTGNGGYGSISEGLYSDARGMGAHAEGYETQTFNTGEYAGGIRNKSHQASGTTGNAGNTQFSVGIGDGFQPNPRKNAFEIMQNGDLYAYGVGNYDGINLNGAYTLAQVIDNLENAVGSAADLAETIVGESDSNNE